MREYVLQYHNARKIMDLLDKGEKVIKKGLEQYFLLLLLQKKKNIFSFTI